MTRARQRGFMPGMVIELNVSIAILGVALAVFWPWSLGTFRPVPVEPIKAELVAPAATAAAALGGLPEKQG